MIEQVFLDAVKRATDGDLPLVDAIGQAARLGEGGRPDLAVQLYKIWLGFNPEDPQRFVIEFNRSAIQSQTGDTAGAIEALRAALAVNPDFMPAYINLGGLLERGGQLDEGMEQWRVALSRLPSVTGLNVGYKAALLKQMARVLADAQRSGPAEIALRELLSLDPHQRDVIEQFVAARLSQCKWPIVTPWEGMPRNRLAGGLHPLSMAAYADDPLLQLGLAARYIERIEEERPSGLQFDRRHAAIEPGRRLRIGYVSSDLRDHAVGYLMAELFEVHDRSQVEVFAYYCGRPSDHERLTQRTKAAVEHWVDIRELSDEEAARRIAADGIDILVDVNGHTRDSRTGLFARRPAPVQVNWLGYPGTMGSPYHQYIVADPWIIPPEYELYYSESVLRLPCYQPNDRRRPVADERPSRAEAGLPEDAFVFCCFNGTQKLTRFTFERWMEILRRVPHGVLWLLESNAETFARLGEAAERYGISRDRLIVAPKRPNNMHLARYPLADLFLDTLPYGAHTTASDSLWMGVPVLTLSGRCFASRVCGSLVRSAGIPDLVCERVEDYVERAVALAHDPAAMAGRKAALAAARDTCALFDIEGLTRRLEDLYGEMAEAHRRGATPRPQLDNLDSYLAVGLSLDHDAQELTAVADYHGLYREALRARHLKQPMRPDGRLWAAADVAAAEDPSAFPGAEAAPQLRRA